MEPAQIKALVTAILRAFCLCGGLIMLGTVLRAKIKLFQKLYLPACVIGGFIGLILSPTVMGDYAILKISSQTNSILSYLAPTLFMMIMASMPMCSASLSRKNLREKGDVWFLALIISIAFVAQFGIGFFVNAGFAAAGSETYAAFGAELAQGFTGGHSIAAMHGSLLQGLDQPYWEVAQGVTLTVATVGIIAGIVLGIVFINIAARKGYTKYISSPAEIPEEMRIGFYKSVEDQPDMGKQTTNNASIDSISFHLALILLVTGLGYLINDFVQANSIPVLSDFSAWVYMLLLMYIIWPLIKKLKLDKHFNAQTKTKITSTLTDFIIVSAIVSIPLDLVLSYWKPILVMCVIALIVTPVVIWFGCKYFCINDWMEKAMGPMGMNHGDFITGVLLIRMVDPDLKSTAMEDFSLAYAVHNLYALPFFLFIVPYCINKGATTAGVMCLIHIAVMVVLLFVCKKLFKKKA